MPSFFRIVQEAMTSVVRHANARNVSVSLNDAGDHVEVKVQDDGSGFDFSGIRENFRQPVNLGLIGMEERARQMGGQFAVESRIGAGTIVRVRIPMI